MSRDIVILNNDLQAGGGGEKTVEGLIEEFLSQHSVRKNSRDRYRKSLKQFLIWTKGRNISQINRAAILDYKEDLLNKTLEDGNKMSPLTVGAYLVAVRLFYDYLNQEYNIKNVAKGIKMKRSNKFERAALNEEQCAKLLLHFESEGDLRDYAIVNLLLRTGMRTIEIVRANIEDVSQIQGKNCLFVQGKGRDDKKDFVLLTEKALLPIKSYIAERGVIAPKDPLFTSTSNNNRGERLTTKTISTLVKSGLIAIGLSGKEYTAHSCRHSAASIMLDRGESLERVQEVLRHTNSQTTKGYVHKANEKRRIEESPESSLDNAF